MLPGGLVLAGAAGGSGRFRLLEHEARHRWGYAYRARDLRDGRAARVHVVDPEVVDAATFGAILRDQDEVTRRLAGEGVAPLVGLGVGVLGRVVVEATTTEGTEVRAAPGRGAQDASLPARPAGLPCWASMALAER